MAKPRIFLSSTFFDLRQIRANLDRFIRDIGYEPVRNEQGNIPYGKEEKLEEYCYKEIGNIDILVSIIGGRFGSPSSQGDQSISQREISTALLLDKQVFIFIDKNVYGEFRTYLANKQNTTIHYQYADNIKIYEFIEYLEGLPKNNPVQTFESSDEIVSFLKEQWAGLFQRFLQEQRRVKEINFLQSLESTTNTLHQLINYLTDEKKGTENVIRDILISNHPAFERLKTLLNIPYRVFFLTRDEMSAWLTARNYKQVDLFEQDHVSISEWVWNSPDKTKQQLLKISDTLFDDEGNLKPIKKEDWKDLLIIVEVKDIKQPSIDIADDLPF